MKRSVAALLTAAALSFQIAPASAGDCGCPSGFKLPKLELPKLCPPKLDLPKLCLPKLDMPKLPKLNLCSMKPSCAAPAAKCCTAKPSCAAPAAKCAPACAPKGPTCCAPASAPCPPGCAAPAAPYVAPKEAAPAPAPPAELSPSAAGKSA